MESAAVEPAVAEDRLRWLDLLPPVAFIILGIVLIVAVLIGVGRADRAFYRANLETISLLTELGIYLAFGAGLAMALRRLRAPLAYLGLRRPTSSDVGLVLISFIPWYAGIVIVSWLSALLFNGGRLPPGNSRLLFIQRPQDIGILLLALLVTAVAAPICEEIFFRGMLFRLLWMRLSLAPAVAISATAFGLAHAGPGISPALLPVFAYMGVVLALIYARTRVLTNTIMLHGLSNAVATIAAFSGLAR